MDIQGTTRVCGLIGNPVHHTLSPAIHNELAEALGIDMVYVPFEVQKESLEEAVKGAMALDILGMNVTIPHKKEVIPFLSEIDSAAENIGAVNTLVRTSSGNGFKGYNTDYYGIKRSLNRAETELKDASVIILGAGGVSRPAAFLCANEGAREVYILNRTLENAEKLADAVNKYADRTLCRALPISDYKKIPNDKQYLCFQMTSVGLFPDNDKAVIEDPDFYKMIHTGFDAVYRPLQTAFLRKCANAGAKCIDGLRVLLYQGTTAFELWNDVKVSDELSEKIYGKLLGCLLENENIVLTGFMGSGKSAVSAKISKILGYGLIDSDSVIEEEQDRKISDIFAESGEEAFRDMETETIQALIDSEICGAVLAVGGGLPVRDKNRKLLRQFGKVIYLRTKPETVYKRVRYDTSRPLLHTDDVIGTIKKLQSERRDYYEDGADVIIDTDDKTVRQIAEEIIRSIL